MSVVILCRLISFQITKEMARFFIYSTSVLALSVDCQFEKSMCGYVVSSPGQKVNGFHWEKTKEYTPVFENARNPHLPFGKSVTHM